MCPTLLWSWTGIVSDLQMPPIPARLARQAIKVHSTQAIPGLFYFVPRPSRISSIEQGWSCCYRLHSPWLVVDWEEEGHLPKACHQSGEIVDFLFFCYQSGEIVHFAFCIKFGFTPTQFLFSHIYTFPFPLCLSIPLPEDIMLWLYGRARLPERYDITITITIILIVYITIIIVIIVLIIIMLILLFLFYSYFT